MNVVDRKTVDRRISGPAISSALRVDASIPWT
jgi:hypothetical protein